MLNVKRVALNTAVMYLYLIINTVVVLYTSRVILQVLGFVDFGIYSVVGGVVLLLKFLQFTMTGSVQRYLNFEMAQNKPEAVRNVFNVAFAIHLLISVLVFILGETAGFWFLRNFLTIPPDRMIAAEWVLHFTILTFICTVMSVPCSGILNARENMLALSLVNLITTFGKLAAALTLLSLAGDKLELYSVLVFAISASALLVNYLVCWIFYKESHFRLVRDKKIYRELAGFASWNLIGDVATIAKSQGTTILFNVFFGPAVNAANGLAAQINGQVRNFSTMINVASNPQIVKTYASNDRVSMYKLVFQATKISFFLMFTICLPLLLEMEFILRLWLSKVPEFTAIFARLVLVDALIIVLSSTLVTVARATGKIAKVQLIVSSILLLNIPCAYALLRQGLPPFSVFFVSITISSLVLVVRMLLLRSLAGLSIRAFSGNVLVRLVFLVMMTVVPVVAFQVYVPDRNAQMIVNLVAAPLISVFVMWFFVFQGSDRSYVMAAIPKVLNKLTGGGGKRGKKRAR